MARICIIQKDTCADSYLESLIASNPQFIEAREALAGERSWPEVENAEHITALENILKLDLSLSAQVWVLNQRVFTLNRLNQIDDAVFAIKEWNLALSELLAIYPPAASAYYTEAIQYGLLEEAKGMNSDAINTYREAASIAANDRMVPDSARYEIDLGLARALRNSGYTRDAKVLCDGLSGRWRRLASHPPHHPWERWEDGVGELEGRWEFSCGNPAKGLQLIEGAAKQNPESDMPYVALAQYYYSFGKIDKARDAEATASRLRNAWAKKLGEF